jgi:hypothetical protein
MEQRDNKNIISLLPIPTLISHFFLNSTTSSLELIEALSLDLAENGNYYNKEINGLEEKVQEYKSLVHYKKMKMFY